MFVTFINPHTKKQVLINSDHVRSAAEIEGHNHVRLVMDDDHAEDVMGDLHSVGVWLQTSRR